MLILHFHICVTAKYDVIMHMTELYQSDDFKKLPQIASPFFGSLQSQNMIFPIKLLWAQISGGIIIAPWLYNKWMHFQWHYYYYLFSLFFPVPFFLRFLVLGSFRDPSCAVSHLFPISKANPSSFTRSNQETLLELVKSWTENLSNFLKDIFYLRGIFPYKIARNGMLKIVFIYLSRTR